MANKSFIFSWDIYGVEAIIPISQYEYWEHEYLLKILERGSNVPDRNPLQSIIQALILRAKFNNQRQYEIYAVGCSEECDEAFWRQQWEVYPQATADIIRERGHKIYSDRIDSSKVKIK
jgi:hypothetical protein